MDVDFIFLISFYNEAAIVRSTIDAISRYDSAAAICVQSAHDGHQLDLDYIRRNSLSYKVLPNLGNKLSKWELPSAAVCRNYSECFCELKKSNINANYIVAILGDTHIIDIERFTSLIKTKMIGKRAAVLQAIGQTFHSADSSPPEKCGGRPQTDDITDIMPQLFVLRGDVGGFTNIRNTNKFTSEQNLGDELVRHIDNWSVDVVRLNNPKTYAYGFSDGVRLQAKG